MAAAVRFSDDPAVPPEVILQASEHEYDLCTRLEIRETGAAAGQALGDVFDIVRAGDTYTLTLKPNTIAAERLSACELYAPKDASGRTFSLAVPAPRYGGIVGSSGITFYSTPASAEYQGEGALTFTVDADIRNFLDAYLDGAMLTRTVHYDVNVGSTVITLHESYLQTLAAGEHRLRIVFASGEASATVWVGQTSYVPEEILLDPPKTGGAAGTYALPVLLAALFAAFCLLRWRAAK